MKQCVELESTKVVIGMSGTESECKLTIKEDVLERAEALSLTSLSADVRELCSLVGDYKFVLVFSYRLSLIWCHSHCSQYLYSVAS